MKNRMITISDSGAVNVPTNIKMTDYEIAELLGIMVPNVRGAIKRLLNSRARIDSCGGIVRGNRIIPEYFGLEVVVAIAFQVDSYKADIFRKYILHRTTEELAQSIYIKMDNNMSGIFS